VNKEFELKIKQLEESSSLKNETPEESNNESLQQDLEKKNTTISQLQQRIDSLEQIVKDFESSKKKSK